MRTTPLTTTAALSALLGLAACGASPAEDRTIEIAPQNANEAADEGPDEIGLGGVHAYSDGISVAISEGERDVSGETAVPATTPFAKFAVEVENDSGRELNLGLLALRCTVGENGRRAETILDNEAQISQGFSSTLQNGRSAEIDWGCELGDAESLVRIEVRLQDGQNRPTVYFEGEVD